MDTKDPLLWKMPYCARFSVKYRGMYLYPPSDCPLKWESMTSSMLLNGEEFSPHELRCFDECTHGYDRTVLTEGELRYLTNKGRGHMIKGLTEKDKEMCSVLVVAVQQK